MLFNFDLSQSGQPGPTLDQAEINQVLAATDAWYLGTGSFGESWAFVTASGTHVAKILLDPQTTSKEIDREIRGLTRVTSRYVVRLEEVNLVALAGQQRIVLVFEFIDGGDVMSRIETGQWPAVAEVQSFAAGVLRGLVALHAQEVVHRDIKPENLALRGGDWAQPVILDLGLGRLLDASTLTLYPAMVGTAPYMAPEVIEGRAARKGSDLWSLGILLFLLLTHGHPFLPDPAEFLDADDMYDRVVAGAPALPAAVPDPLRSVVTRLLSSTSFERGSAARALTEIEGGP